MSALELHPIAFETLVDYWSGELAPEQEAALDEHLIACESCSALSARVAAITEALRAVIPAVVSPEMLAVLGARGLRIVENPMQPGEASDAIFPADADILLHRLSGLRLTPDARVRFVMRVEQTGEVLLALDDVPVDREHDTVLVACQQHFASLPHDTVAELHVQTPEGRERVERYTIRHHYERWHQAQRTPG